MAHRTLINGTGYDISGGRDLIGGTGYGKKKGRVLVNGTGYDVPFSSGIPIGTLAVGSTVKISVNGKSYDFLVVNQGIPSNSSLYDSSCNGTWLLMKDIYETRQWHNSEMNNYADSNINAYLNGTFANLIDTVVRSAIKSVKLPYKAGYDGQIQAGASGLQCKTFLLSGAELGFAGRALVPDDGAKLAYFDANTGADQKRIAYTNGSAATWWTRTPLAVSRGAVAFISTDGNMQAGYITGKAGIRPAFILPSEFPLIQNADGSYSPAA